MLRRKDKTSLRACGPPVLLLSQIKFNTIFMKRFDFFKLFTLTSFGFGFFNTQRNYFNDKIEAKYNNQVKEFEDLQKDYKNLINSYDEEKINSLNNNELIARKSIELENSIKECTDKAKECNKLATDLLDYSAADNEEFKKTMQEAIKDRIDDCCNAQAKCNEKALEMFNMSKEAIENLIKNNKKLNFDYFDNLSDFFASLNTIDSLIITNICGVILITLTLFSIISVLFGDILINYFNLKQKNMEMKMNTIK